MDIKTVFLQGNYLERDFLTQPPKEANAKGKIWRLKKCVYGINDASLHWYKKVREVVTGAGGRLLTRQYSHGMMTMES